MARFPEKGDKVEVVASGPGDNHADKEWSVHYVQPGIRDQATLKQIAEEYYNGAGRQELLVRVKTRNLSSYGGGNLDPDLLDMKVGDQFEIHVDRRFIGGSIVNETEAKLTSQDANQKRLQDLGYDVGFAAAYAKAYNDAGFLRQYKMKELQVDWSSNDGVSVEIAGVNYVLARVDAPTSAGTKRD